MSSIPELKPEVTFIFELLTEVRVGKLRIPKFQRSYVWRRQQMTELLDSINRQFPIGSLLVWETEEKVSSRNWIGPLAIPAAPSALSAHVLDGQQRLSTLTGVLMAAAENKSKTQNDDEDPERWWIWFNIRDDIFEHPKSPDAKPESWHFPMWKLLDTVSFLHESQRILQDNGDKGAAYVQKIQELLQRFQSYKVPVIRIKYTGINRAVEIFARLNSKGQPISPDEMVSALSYRENQVTISEHINAILEALDKYGFRNIDRVTILRSLLAILGEDVYRTDWTRFTDTNRTDPRDKLQTVVEQTQTALIKSLEFLAKLGVYNHRLLPYSMQLVVLSSFFSSCSEPTPAQINFLERWFWVSSFTGWFASRGSSKVGALIKEFREQIATEDNPELLESMRLDEPAQAFPKTFNMRSARVRSLLLVMIAQEPYYKKQYSKNKISYEKIPVKKLSTLFAEHGHLAIGKIAATVNDKTLASSPANRVLNLALFSGSGTVSSNSDFSQAKNWLTQLDGDANNILKSHAIPVDALSDLKNNKADIFLQKRLDYLIELERDFMKSKGVNLPLGREIRAVAIDTE
ncbi:DUF262 domain-containing protein [Candidatus Venteria ishoeyi]|uniref:DUF262 domain-containing protein n=1 Tax=Candidatus Venteria ishoeyi TaxID=1899563 RepID=UPI0025A624F3|nr:DUF262 domain-containing protein [Candidatus Venteria ishoeyi]MDM8546237.1 DUF262 domain-containing protein [Candidatus Venteria ishoeyi]